MLDFSGIPMLDVAIGLAFLFFLLSVVCSSVGEAIAAVFKLRAKNLETGIRSLLGDPEKAEAFFKDWRIVTLSKPPRSKTQKARKARVPEKKSRPSYIDPKTAALVIYDTVFPDAAKEAIEHDDNQARPASLVSSVDAAVTQVRTANPRLGALIQDVLHEAGRDVATARSHLEDRFNEVMDRATGWYKRRMQLVMFFVALAVAASINADTFNVADRLARDEPLRARVVAQATAAATTAAPAGTATPGTPEEVRDRLKEARATALPLGWSKENIPDHNTVWAALLKAAGLLVTAFALMLGAPFWFDVLGKFARLRSTGNRIGTPKTDAMAPSDRDDRLKRTAVRSG
jgi:hypothetical protein